MQYIIICTSSALKLLPLVLKFFLFVSKFRYSSFNLSLPLFPHFPLLIPNLRKKHLSAYMKKTSHLKSTKLIYEYVCST